MSSSGLSISRTEAQILNRGLSLAIRFPQCCAAKGFARDLVYSMAQRSGTDVDFSSWQAALLSRYPWVNSENASRLFLQAMYYAMKDGLAG